MLPGLFYLALETQPLPPHNLYSTVQQRPVLRLNYHTNCHLKSTLDDFGLNPLLEREAALGTLTGVLIYQKKGFNL